MTLLSKIYSSIFAKNKQNTDLSASHLTEHNEAGKQDALDAIDILIEYKSTVQEFTDEIIEFWPLPRRIMERYHFEDAEQLNEWLDNLA